MDRPGDNTGMGDGSPGLTGDGEREGPGKMEAFKEAAGHMGDQLKDKASETADDVKENISEYGGRLGDRLRTEAVSGLDRAAEAVHTAGDWIVQKGDPIAKAAPVARQVADALGTSAEYVRTQDMTKMKADVENEVQEYPLRSAAIVFGIGFVLGRILR
jgi:ElaB/YqjD/DUF883 family membrane-anchored ribosome-binding protein